MTSQTRTTPLNYGLLAVTFLLAAFVAISAMQAIQVEGGLVSKVGRLALYLAPVPFVLLLTRLIPADRSQPVFGPGLLQDSGYFILILVFRMALTAFFIVAATTWIQEHLAFMALSLGEGWPVWLKVLTALLIGDFLAWFHHLVRHKVSSFWEFHKLHHSQRQMNYFTEFRVHPIDYIIATLIIIVPQSLLQVDAPTIMLVGIIVQWHTMIYHSNLRTNYGPLRYVLVTPQSHRVHHSTEPEHFDSNFGVIFSIWDHLFGTQHRDYDTYPKTGVENEFPDERRFCDVLMLRSLFLQMIHPFIRVLRRNP